MFLHVESFLVETFTVNRVLSHEFTMSSDFQIHVLCSMEWKKIKRQATLQITKRPISCTCHLIKQNDYNNEKNVYACELFKLIFSPAHKRF